MWKNKNVSVILPTYNEKDSIAGEVEAFFATGYVDEVVVVNNNAVKGTDTEVARTNAKLVYEPSQGYGYAIQKGLQAASGDLLIIAEPDGTFVARDIVKLLSYTDDFQIVYGSRTLYTMIWEGANMGWFLRQGNFFVAKLIEVFFNTTTLSDVGCTFRLLDRPSAQLLLPRVGDAAAFHREKYSIYPDPGKLSKTRGTILGYRKKDQSIHPWYEHDLVCLRQTY